MWTGRRCLWPLNCHWRWIKDTSLWHKKRCQSMKHRHNNSPTPTNLKFSPWWEKWRWPSFGTAKVVKTLITIAAYWSRQPHNYSRHNNTSLHTSWKTMTALDCLKSDDILWHPSYSLDLAPGDISLFHKLKEHVKGHWNASYEEAKAMCVLSCRKRPQISSSTRCNN